MALPKPRKTTKTAQTVLEHHERMTRAILGQKMIASSKREILVNLNHLAESVLFDEKCYHGFKELDNGAVYFYRTDKAMPVTGDAHLQIDLL